MSMLDLTGQRFERLTVIGFSHKTKTAVYWKCICDCGKEVIASRQSLRCGDKKSCGCYHRDFMKSLAEKVHRLNKKPSEIEVCDTYAKIKLSNCDKCALIDIEDIDKVKEYRWHLTAYGYVRTNEPRGNGKNTGSRLHRKILGDIPKGFEVDHINQDKLDNRKSNLRIVKPIDNINNNYASAPRTSTGFKYIYHQKNANNYRVLYTRYGKTYIVGTFKTIDEAREKLNESLIKNNFKELIQ